MGTWSTQRGISPTLGRSYPYNIRPNKQSSAYRSGSKNFEKGGGGLNIRSKSWYPHPRLAYNLPCRYLLLSLCLVLLCTIVKQFLVHLHEQFQCIIDQPMYRPEKPNILIKANVSHVRNTNIIINII